MRNKGFTLVEFAVVCILVTIIMPKMTASKDRTKLSACKENLKHLAIAIKMYSNDHSHFPYDGVSLPWRRGSTVTVKYI